MLVKIIIFIILYYLIKYLLKKGLMYYRAYKSIQRKSREQRVNDRSSLNLRAFEVEDARYEEVDAGSEDKT
ncbi:MAG: DUF6019 family protein [Gemmatimonadota bacterium]|nr:DUF6019 family protein [Gemmatimonadota bacterium]